MTGRGDSVYMLPLDGSRVSMQPPFVAKGVTIANGTSQTATLLDGRALSVTVVAGEVKRYTLNRAGEVFTGQLAGLATGDGCRVTFTEAMLEDTGTLPTLPRAPTEVLLRQQANRAGGVYTDVVAVASSVRTLMFDGYDSATLTFAQLTGVQSGHRYLYGIPPQAQPVWERLIPFFSTLDSAITINTTVAGGGGGGYTLYGLLNPLSPGLFGDNGDQLVALVNASGQRLGYPTTALSTVRGTRASQTLVTASAVTGAGGHRYGPFDLGHAVGGAFLFVLTLGGVVQLYMTDPSDSVQILVVPVTTVAPAVQWIEVGPGITPASAAPIYRYSQQLVDALYLSVGHGDAAARSYQLYFYPAQ